MIEVTPAPLTQTPAELEQLLVKFVSEFESIDIDIQEQPFASNSTLSWEEALMVAGSAELPSTMSLGWDLKLAQPKAAVSAILKQAADLGRKYRIYVYSTSQIDFLDELDLGENTIGLGILGNTNLRGIEFLNRFPEVQLMTIHSEAQGEKLDPYLLDRVTEIREMGYAGLISLDGGVNLNSAELINAYAKEVRIDRVSVGSYFQTASDVIAAKQKLEIALNIGIIKSEE